MTNDNPDLDAIIEEASLTSEESPAEETPEAEVEDQTAEEPETPSKEEEAPEEEIKETEAEEESFADKPDLSAKSPEELEEIYQNWNKAYTQKRQAEREQLKQMEEKLREMEAKVPVQPEKDLNQMTPAELQEHFAKKAQEIATQAKENSYIESQEKSFYELDGRLNEDNPNFDEALFYSTVGKVTKLREQFEAQNGTVVGFDFVGEAKKQIEAFDNETKNRVQSYLKKQGTVAKQKVNKFSKDNPKSNSGSVKKSGKMDLDEAFSEALSEVGGKFSW